MRVLFIIGPPRSGTTLMHDLFALHPEVSAHSEDFHRFHHNLTHFRHREERQDHFRLTTADASGDLAKSYRSAIATALAEAGREVFVLKISTLSIQVDFVRALCPEARFVQMVRDGRDAACSMEDLRRAIERERGHERLLGPAPEPFGLWCAESFTDKHLRAAATWYYHVTRSMLDLDFTGGDSWLRVRYEDLVAEPRGVLERVATFAGLEITGDIEEDLAEIRDRPGATGGLGFSTTQASGDRRIGRYREELSNDLRVAVAPLLETPMLLLGYDPDPPHSDERFVLACARLGIDVERWRDRVHREMEWFAMHRRAFAPERMLRYPDQPTLGSRPLLIDGAATGCEQVLSDGVIGGTISWIQKQNRRHTFADPGRVWLEVVARLDGRHTVAEILADLELDKTLERGALAELGRLTGLGFVGYV